MSKVAISTAGIAIALLGLADAQATKYPPLAEVTPIGGSKLFFDPCRIRAVYQTPVLTLAKDQGLGLASLGINRGAIKTHILGIAEAPFPIEGDPKSFLDNTGQTDKFVHLHTVSGDLYLRATAANTINEPFGSTASPQVRSFIYPGPTGLGRSQTPWQVFEAPEDAKRAIDDVRTREDEQDIC